MIYAKARVEGTIERHAVAVASLTKPGQFGATRRSLCGVRAVVGGYEFVVGAGRNCHACEGVLTSRGVGSG